MLCLCRMLNAWSSTLKAMLSKAKAKDGFVGYQDAVHCFLTSCFNMKLGSLEFRKGGR